MSNDTVSLGRDFSRALDPVLLARDCGIVPDKVQAKLLTTDAKRVLLCCTRQWGKSTTSALIALHAALYQAPSTIILISPSQPQSTELFKRLHMSWSLLPGASKATQESLTRMQLDNGSRIISLPGSEKTARGYTANLSWSMKPQDAPMNCSLPSGRCWPRPQANLSRCLPLPASVAFSMKPGRAVKAGSVSA